MSYTVVGELRPSSTSVTDVLLLLGVAKDVRLIRPITDGAPISFAEVEIDEMTMA